jgi:prevent-host-death family protein
MKQARISDLKNNLSRYLDLVRQGQTIQVLDRDTPIAFLTPISEAKTISGEDRLKQMERKGLVRKGNSSNIKTIISSPPPGKNAGVLKALLKEREENR